jgi:hypothetical protein
MFNQIRKAIIAAALKLHLKHKGLLPQQEEINFPESSNVQTIYYNDTLHHLTVRFRSGGLYEYMMVAPDIIAQWTQAESKGRFFHTTIKDKYPYKRIN